MIYSNTTPLYLVESDADEFLDSIGVELYDDSVAIGEHVFDGAYAEEILAENGIYLYEEGIVLEGKQADEYRARKAKEAEDEARKYDKYDNKGLTKNAPNFLKGSRARSNVGNKSSLKQGIKNASNTKTEDRIRRMHAEEIVERDRLNRSHDYSGKGLRVSKDEKGRVKSVSTDTRYSPNSRGNYYSDRFCDEEKGRRIAHNAARDAANRHLRRHTKYVKESAGIFESVEII